MIEKRNLEIKIGPYSVGHAASLSDPFLLSRVQDYKRLTSSRMIPIDRSEIASKIPSSEYFASRKIDGEFCVMIYDNKQALTLNPGGTVRVGLPAIEEAASMLEKAGISRAIVVGELHAAHDDSRRERVHDVSGLVRSPKTIDDINRLRFSIFDLMDVNGNVNFPEFAVVWRQIIEVFGKGNRAIPVLTTKVKSSTEVESMFKEMVDNQGAEGIVLRSDAAGMYKLKPRHTLDAAVIGFTESTGDRAGMIHDLLLALKRGDGTLHVLCRVGGGFSDDLRRTLLADLKDRIVNSEYAEVNSDHVAYQMVEPRWIAEISCLDLISQSTRGAPINRMTLDWHAGSKLYRIVRRLPLVSVISPQFVRFREDKTCSIQDIRIEQVANIVDVPMFDRDALQMTLPKSEILRREVFVKSLKGEMMVRKFVMWKTNKESTFNDHPAFVVHFTDFSPNRAMPLTREVRVSNSRQQIDSLFDELKEENVKKGWEPAGATLSGLSPDATDSDSQPAKAKAKDATKTVPGPDGNSGSETEIHTHSEGVDPPKPKRTRKKKE